MVERQQITSAAAIARLAVDLMRIPSPTGHESAIVGFTEDLLRAHHVHAERQEVTPGRFNLIIPPAAGRGGYIVGHLDTIPFRASDYDDIYVSDSIVRGPGAVDMKGPLAALLAALFDLSANPGVKLRPDIGVAFTVGEEELGDGAAAFLDEYVPQWAVLTEATNLSICNGSWGCATLDIQAHGLRAHAMNPQLGRSAVPIITEALHRLFAYCHSGQQPFLVNVSKLRSEECGYSLLPVCEAGVDITLPPGVEWGPAKDELFELLRADGTGGALEVNESFFAPAFTLPDDAAPILEIRRALLAAGLPAQLTMFPGPSDANLLHQAGVAAVLFGPGDPAWAHRRGERVSPPDLAVAARAYKALMTE